MSGLIVDSNNEPVSGADIVIWPDDESAHELPIERLTAITDDLGRFIFEDLYPHSDYLLAAYSEGFPPVFYKDQFVQSFATPIDLSENDITDLHIVLSKAA